MLDYAYIDTLQIHGTDTIGLVSIAMGSPAPRAVSDVRPVDDGAIDSTQFYGPRSIEIVGRVSADTSADLQAAIDNVKGALILGTTHTLKWRRTGLDFDEQAEVRVDSSVDVPFSVGPLLMLPWGVSLFCADPRLYDTTMSTGSYDPTDAGGGALSFDLIFDLDFGADPDAGHLAVVNEGNVNTPPTFVITGPVLNPVIDNDTSGLSIYTQSCDLAEGDTLTIDVQARTVVLNGDTSRPDLINPSLTTWFNLVPGTNLLRLRGDGMVSTETELSVTFHSARI